MESRGNTYQFRSVPLIQRGDWSTLSDAGAYTSARDRGSSYATPRLREDEHERRSSRRRADEDEPTTRRTRRRSRDVDRERVRDRGSNERSRAERRNRRAPDVSAPTDAAPPREHVSAYLDESTVTSVTPRSERRRAPRQSGFTLVPPLEVPSFDSRPSAGEECSSGYAREEVRVRRRSDGRDRWSQDGVSQASSWGDTSYTDYAGYPTAASGRGAAVASASMPAPYFHDTGPSYGSGWDYGGDVGASSWADEPYGGDYGSRARRTSFDRDAVSLRDEGRLPRTTRRPRAGETTVARDWLYTGEDEDPHGISGAARRREAVVGALTAVPRAAFNGLLGMLSHTRGVFVLILAAMTAFMLYAPVRELYVANRRLDTLQATYDALLEENNAIRGDLELLQTREGIENEARARGYVAPGETKVVVEGLPEDESPGAMAYVKPLELPDNRPWYIRVLDELFKYDPEE